MKKIMFMLLVCGVQYSFGQSACLVFVRNQATGQPLAGATVSLRGLASKLSDDSGRVFFSPIIQGTYLLRVEYSGMLEEEEKISFNSRDTILREFSMKEDTSILEEVFIQSTRTGRTIRKTPTRVEVIDREELDEKSNMRPANVSMLLHESTGLQVQQTSATTGNASIRSQGLDGRYTQLLKDGYPNFGNFASGLSILEIPPLDLKQVEVIKGPASTLYGGGAIAGVVNFISRVPTEEFEGDFILNHSSIGQRNAGGYVSTRKKKHALSLLVALNSTDAFDVDKDGFSEVPKSWNVHFNPAVYLFPGSSWKIRLGHSVSNSSFRGGDMEVIKGNASASRVYFENNRTTRNISTLEIDKRLPSGNSFKLKQSVSVFDRNISIPGFQFSGSSTNAFTDASYLAKFKKHTMIAGANILMDEFDQSVNTPGINQDSRTFTAGIYWQDTWDISERVELETGLRLDRAKLRHSNGEKSETFFLPRVSALFHLTDRISSRLGAGFGYKTPTIFTEQTESLQYRNVLALQDVDAERSFGATADVNFHQNLSGDITLSLNQLFFYTSIRNPLVLQSNQAGALFFTNVQSPVQTKGMETNLKLVYKDHLKLFLGYTYTDAQAMYKTENRFLPLVPRNKINSTLMYEKEDNIKLGLEAYFTDRQRLSNGQLTESFWELGFMAQKTFGRFSLFVNFENFTDQRQSRFKRVVNPPDTNPSFDEIWNHTEGFVVNGGIKLKF